MTAWRSEGLFVKVCGLGTEDDVAVANRAGADAIGFVWWEKSPRHRDLATIHRLAALSEIPTVLVTVDLESAALLDAAGRAGVDAVQPHGEHAAVAAAAARRLGFRVIRPIPAGPVPADAAPTDLLLVDTPHPDLPGGSGQTFDWDTLAIDRPFLLAGGLTPDNVTEAVATVRPFGVDASSGLESSPGVKDADLIQRFIEEAKQV